MNLKKEDIKKTLTEECWIELVEDFCVRIDYPTYPHSAILDSIVGNELAGLPVSEASWSYYVRSIVKGFRNLSIDGKDHQPTLRNGLMSVADFEMLHGMGVAMKIYLEGMKRLSVGELDRKKSQSASLPS